MSDLAVYQPDHRSVSGDEWTSAVSWIQRGVGFDQAGTSCAVHGGGVAVQAADVAVGEGDQATDREPDRGDGVADFRCASGEMKLVTDQRLVSSHQRQVMCGVRADDCAGGALGSVDKADDGRLGDNVINGRDQGGVSRNPVPTPESVQLIVSMRITPDCCLS